MTFKSRLRAYCELVRLPAVFTAPGDVILGAFIASLWADVAYWKYAALIASSVLIYCAGMALNDVKDVEADLAERPQRPIPSGRISLRAGWWSVIIMQLLALGTALIISPLACGLAGLTIALTYLYNSPLKTTALGPIIMGSCRYSNVLVGASAAGLTSFQGASAIVVFGVPLFNLIYVFGLTHLARHEVHGADRRIVTGWAKYMMLLSFIPLVLAPILFDERPIMMVCVLGLIPMWLVPELLHLRKDISPLRIRFAVLRCIMGITVVTGSFTIYAGGYWEGALILALLYPGKWFGRWFYAT